MKRAIAVTVVLLAGCAGNPYVKPGATDRDFKTDLAACKAEWQQYRLLQSDATDACLQGKGWRQRPTT